MSINVNPIVIDNAIPKSLQLELKQKLKYESMWYLAPSAAGVEDSVDENNTRIEDGPQMVHGLVNENQYNGPLGQVAFTMINHFERHLDIDVRNVIRVKANLLMKDTGFFNKYHPPHIDVPDKDCISIVYYVEDSDGDTYIFDKTVDTEPKGLKVVQSVSPKQGRITVFPSRIFHASQKPVKSETRTIVNFILQINRAKMLDLFGI